MPALKRGGPQEHRRLSLTLHLGSLQTLLELNRKLWVGAFWQEYILLSARLGKTFCSPRPLSWGCEPSPCYLPALFSLGDSWGLPASLPSSASVFFLCMGECLLWKVAPTRVCRMTGEVSCPFFSLDAEGNGSNRGCSMEHCCIHLWIKEIDALLCLQSVIFSKATGTTCKCICTKKHVNSSCF